MIGVIVVVGVVGVVDTDQDHVTELSTAVCSHLLLSCVPLSLTQFFPQTRVQDIELQIHAHTILQGHVSGSSRQIRAALRII